MVFRRAAACLLYAAAALLAARLMRLPLWDAALLFEDLAPGAALMLLSLFIMEGDWSFLRRKKHT